MIKATNNTATMIENTRRIAEKGEAEGPKGNQKQRDRTKRKQRDAEGTGRKKREPEGTRRNQRESKGPCGNQRQPEEIRENQMEPGAKTLHAPESENPKHGDS